MKQETIRDQRVEVTTDRAMNERNENVLLHFLDRLLFDEVRPDTPILFRRIENLVIDPTATGRLQ